MTRHILAIVLEMHVFTTVQAGGQTRICLEKIYGLHPKSFTPIQTSVRRISVRTLSRVGDLVLNNLRAL